MPQGQSSSVNADVLTPVSEELNELFISLITLQDQLKPFFSDIKPQLVGNQLNELENFYHTVSDQDGVLSLQLKNSKEMEENFNFLHTKPWHIDRKNALKEYAPGMAVSGLSGMAVTYGVGVGIQSAVILTEVSTAVVVAEGVTQGALIGAFALSPVIIVPSLVVGTVFSSAAWFSIYMTRQLSLSIQRALDLYDAAEKPDAIELIEAEDRLKAELGHGPDARLPFSRAMRSLSASSEQFDFIALLLAQIHIKKEADTGYDELQEVLDNSIDKKIKGMALISQLDMLSPTSNTPCYKQGASGLNKETMSLAERIRLLCLKIKELNSSHAELVKLYFNILWDAYNELLKTLENGACLRSPEEFLKQKLAINKMINFKGMHVLRYMGNKGKLAEILLTFIQAISHVMHDLHNRYMQRKHDNNAAPSNDESEEAKKQLHLCINLMDEYEAHVSYDKFSKADIIFSIIKEYKKKYYAQCDTILDKPEEKEPLNGLIFRALPPLTPIQAEIVAENALRNDPNPTSALKSAKVSFSKNKNVRYKF